MSASTDKKWWKEGVVYQIYPRSFKDTSGTGVGDLRGIIDKLDYIKSLGVDVIWLNPVYSSPNHDMGYDISDYRNIMAEFGTMEDFEELIEGLHERGIKLTMDLVVNHTSDEHEWFKQASSSRENPYRDYYHWWPAEKGTPPTRVGFLDKDGKGWTYHEATDAYYLHYFSNKQPDLNWENPKVRQEVYDMMHFWFKKGIDGFRMDVITYISKDMDFPPLPEGCTGLKAEKVYASGPKLHEYLHEMNREVLSHYDIMTVAEAPGITHENIMDLVDPAREELNMAYHFEHPHLGLYGRKLLNEDARNLVKFKQIHAKWDAALGDTGWGTIYFGNHDQPRMVTRWGNDSPEFRVKSSKLLTTFLLSMRGTPFYYMGDEIGMSNIQFDSIEQYRDIETISSYNQTKIEGGDLQELLDAHKITGRDNGRTPIQWTGDNHGGFTTGDPWLTVNEEYSEINVADQEKDPNSCLNYFRQLTALRKKHEALIYGDYQDLFPEHKEIYAYSRSMENEKVLVLLNFSDTGTSIELPVGVEPKEILINNDSVNPVAGRSVSLSPWQAIICLLA